jgi:hypothetical protein
MLDLAQWRCSVRRCYPRPWPRIQNRSPRQPALLPPCLLCRHEGGRRSPLRRKGLRQVSQRPHSNMPANGRSMFSVRGRVPFPIWWIQGRCTLTRRAVRDPVNPGTPSAHAAPGSALSFTLAQRQAERSRCVQARRDAGCPQSRHHTDTWLLHNLRGSSDLLCATRAILATACGT